MHSLPAPHRAGRAGWGGWSRPGTGAALLALSPWDHPLGPSPQRTIRTAPTHPNRVRFYSAHTSAVGSGPAFNLENSLDLYPATEEPLHQRAGFQQTLRAQGCTAARTGLRLRGLLLLNSFPLLCFRCLPNVIFF